MELSRTLSAHRVSALSVCTAPVSSIRAESVSHAKLKAGRGVELDCSLSVRLAASSKWVATRCFIEPVETYAWFQHGICRLIVPRSSRAATLTYLWPVSHINCMATVFVSDQFPPLFSVLMSDSSIPTNTVILSTPPCCCNPQPRPSRFSQYASVPNYSASTPPS